MFGNPVLRKQHASADTHHAEGGLAPMKRTLTTLLIAAVLMATLIPAAGFAGASTENGKLVIYTCVPTTQLNMMVSMFNDQYPEIVVDVFSAKDTDLVTRVQAEANAPQGDILLGGSLASFQAIESILRSYTSKNANSIHAAYLTDGMAFTPVQLHVSAVIVNPAAAEKLGVMVKGWESLLDGKLNGQILYMDPSAASADLQQATFINSLARAVNIASPSAPSFVLNSVDAGQSAVGIISEEKAIERKLANAKLQIIYAQEGVAMSASYAGMLEGAKNERSAQLFLDFIISKAYQQAAADRLHLRSVRKDVDFGLKGVAATKDLQTADYEILTLQLIGGADMAGKSR